MDIDRIIDIVRSLKEEAPTMNLGAGQIAGTVEAGRSAEAEPPSALAS